MGGLTRFQEALSRADSLPFLFVGSGMSRRYLGTPDWKGLLQWAAGLTGHPVEYYIGRANKDLPKAASYIANDFHEVWWKSDTYEKSRDVASAECAHDVAAPLKWEMAKHLSATYGQPLPAFDIEIALLKQSQVDGIVTTNYDAFLADSFPGFHVFVGQEDLLRQRSYQLAEIYQIHGSVANPQSLILCASDYERFAQQSPYLIAKLLSVFIEHPVIFIGYSLGDDNVREIITTLLVALDDDHVRTLSEQFVFIDWCPELTDATVSDSVIGVGGGRVLPIMRVATPSYEPVLNVLAGLDRHYPVGLLRRVEEAVVEIVHAKDPARRIEVKDWNDLDDLSDLDVVVGIGKNMGDVDVFSDIGYRSLTRVDLIRDVVLDDRKLIPKKVVLDTLPLLIGRGGPQAQGRPWVPINKYVKASGLGLKELPVEVLDELRRPSPVSNNTSFKVDVANITLPDLIRRMPSVARTLDAIPSLSPGNIDLDELLAFLRKHVDRFAQDANFATCFKKATVVYDRLKYPVVVPSSE